MNRIPWHVPVGPASHRRTSIVRAGSADRNVVARAATRRRAVRSSGSTRRRVTDVGSHPRSRAISGPSRPFRSSATSMACKSGTTDFTSITSRDAVARWKARMSMDPRSPRMLNVTSAAHVQPNLPTRSRVCSTSAAWRPSRRRSSPSACQRRRTSTRAASAAAMRRSVCTVSRSASPRSTRLMADRDDRVRAASSSWLQRRRRRRARIPSPNRTGSIRRASAGPLRCDLSKPGPAYPRPRSPASQPRTSSSASRNVTLSNRRAQWSVHSWTSLAASSGTSTATRRGRVFHAPVRPVRCHRWAE